VTRRSDASLAALLLAQRLVANGAAPLKASEYWPLLARVGDPGPLLGRTATELTARLGDAALAARVAARFASATGVAFELERLEQTGIRVVTSFDAEYPARIRVRLGAAAPPVLQVVGDALGFLADPLVAVVRAPELRGAITAQRLYLATPYPPAAPRTDAGALGRNRLVYASARTTFVVTSESGLGGTWAGASEALSRGFGAVAAWTGPGAGSGNPELVGAGARAVQTVDELLSAADAPG
jgi:predicted Rossmann fold nucleotide-binding protein DprA/Smf involved in DNA uptake